MGRCHVQSLGAGAELLDQRWAQIRQNGVEWWLGMKIRFGKWNGCFADIGGYRQEWDGKEQMEQILMMRGEG
jgi:hypothetical protein